MRFAAIPFYGVDKNQLSAERQGDLVCRIIQYYKIPQDCNEENLFLAKMLYNVEDTESHIVVLLVKGTHMSSCNFYFPVSSLITVQTKTTMSLKRIFDCCANNTNNIIVFRR